MKEIDSIVTEIVNGSTGCFKDYAGTIWYLFMGLKHRDDGPAVEYTNGYNSYYYYGKRTRSKEEFYNPEWRRRVKIYRFL